MYNTFDELPAFIFRNSKTLTPTVCREIKGKHK